MTAPGTPPSRSLPMTPARLAPSTPARPPTAGSLTTQGGPYQSYVYAYPHKSAYRPLTPRPSLHAMWAAEEREALSLYLHIPFCEMRCGFCNLFTRTGAPEELTASYLDALERQATAVGEAIGAARFATVAFGGGTPTYLNPRELERLCDIAARFADLDAVPLAVETSPATATADRLKVLAERGATRISIGVQSFTDAETRAAIRPQKRAWVEAALERIRTAGFATLNIDLIYGIDGQTPASWTRSLEAALRWQPEEIYLYPLYVRPLTGLERRTGAGTDAGPDDRTGGWDGQRLALYRIGRDHLLDQGYQQVSMRMFRRPGEAATRTGAGPANPASGAASGTEPGAEYCCQRDGMVGLGCGARSYTTRLHYSFEYAVDISQVRGIIDDYVRERDFTAAPVGFRLDAGERRRRHLIQSLLQASGLDRAFYRARFDRDVLDDFGPELRGFTENGWLATDRDKICLTAEGLAHSDAIGPALFSARVRNLMASYQAR